LKSSSSDKKSRGKRYGDAEKARILEQALAEIKDGGQITKIAEKLGVTFFTLKTWLKESGSSKESGGAIAQKRGRGRPKGSLKKTAVAPAATTEAGDPVAVVKVPGKRGRKPGYTKAAAAAASATSATSTDSIKNLEQKLEELTRRYINLAHLYGEISSKIGSNKV
jgi:transposase-like protein